MKLLVGLAAISIAIAAPVSARENCVSLDEALTFCPPESWVKTHEEAIDAGRDEPSDIQIIEWTNPNQLGAITLSFEKGSSSLATSLLFKMLSAQVLHHPELQNEFMPIILSADKKAFNQLVSELSADETFSIDDYRLEKTKGKITIRNVSLEDGELKTNEVDHEIILVKSSDLAALFEYTGKLDDDEFSWIGLLEYNDEPLKVDIK